MGEKQLQLQRDSVTALCMGQHGGSMLLLVGHASGAVRVWELKTQLGGREGNACTMTGQGYNHSVLHVCPVRFACRRRAFCADKGVGWHACHRCHCCLAAGRVSSLCGRQRSRPDFGSGLPLIFPFMPAFQGFSFPCLTVVWEAPHGR